MLTPHRAVPRALREAVEAGRVVVLCGAGVSAGPPSYLPSWWGLNASVFEEARRAALAALPTLPPEVRSSIAHLSLGDGGVSVAVFSESLVQTFAGDTWPTVLGVVDGDRPTPTHRALVELGRRAIVAAIVSTNFDTLIEQAFRQDAVPLAVFADPADYRSLATPGSCALYKIHGSAKETSSIVDTVSQKLRGLALPVRRRVAELAQENHVLVLGFSGADLAFSDDYLGIAGELSHGRGITWLVRSGESAPERAKQLVAAAGSRGAVVEGLLPGFLGLLGAEVEPAPNDGDAEQQAGERIRGAVASWLAGPTIGPLVCAVFMARLLTLVERADHAAVIREQVRAQAAYPVSSTAPDRTGLGAAVAERLGVARETVAIFRPIGVPPSTARAYGALARDSIAQGAFGEAAQWLNWQEHSLAGIDEFYAAQGSETPAGVEEYRQRALVEVYVNRATCARAANDPDATQQALEGASLLAQSAGDSGVLAGVQLQYAGLAADRFELEDVLSRLAAARSFANAAGDATRLVEIELLAAETYLDLSEYDTALAALERAARYEELSPDPQRRLMLRHLHAAVRLRRGQPGEALPELKAVVEEARVQGKELLAHRLGWMLCLLLAFHEPARAYVMDELDRLIAAGGDDGSPETAWRDRLRSLRELVASEPTSQLPFLRVHHADEEEGRLRARIEGLEYLQALDDLPQAIADLRWLYGQGRPKTRAIELAQAQLAAAERSGQHELRLLALNSLGIAHDLADEFEPAIRAYEAVLDADPAPPAEAVPLVQHNLAITLARLGRFDEAAELFAQALAGQEALGQAEGAQQSQQQLDRLHQRRHEAGKARAAMREWLARNEFVPASEADPAIPGWDALPRLAERPPVDEAALEIARRDARTPEELGQLALTEWSAGEREAAWGTSRRALAAYAARGDRIGFSRCLNNQAQFSAMVGELDEACRLSRAALAARADAGDLPGQIATLGWLAQYELDRNRPHAAADAASRGIALAELEPVDPHVLLEAGLTLLAAHGELGDDLEVERTARRLLTLFAGIDAPGLDEVRAYLGHFLDDAQSPSPPQPETNALDEMWAEADRFAVLGEVRKTEEILDRLEREFDLTPVQLGRIEGTRGLALQNGGRSDEAFDAFERAIARMDAAGDQEGAARAEMRVAIIARNDNRFQTSAEILRKALLRPLSPESRHDLQIALANTLQGAYQALEPADPDLLAQARRLLTLVSEETNEVERRGIALVNLGVNQALEDDSDTAVATIQTALKDLRRANSGHVAGAEQLLEQLGGGR